MQSLKHFFKKVSVSHAQLAHFSTLAKEIILNFSTLTFITNARTTMPFARLHSQMVCTQSEPAEIPQHMWEDKLLLCAKSDQMFMQTVQQNVFLILNGVPVTSVTDPELIRPSIPVMTHSLD